MITQRHPLYYAQTLKRPEDREIINPAVLRLRKAKERENVDGR